jgi:hypothetical protein
MAGEFKLNSRDGWLRARTAAAPSVLRARVEGYLDDTSDSWPVRLAAAGRRALRHVGAHPGDRSVALDLLAADGLITLALLAQAETNPSALREFAAGLLECGSDVA